MFTTTTSRPSKSRGPRSADTGPVVEVRGLRKRYGSTEVLCGVDLAVAAGELFGLLGTNGAGKTTAVEILQGLLRPDSGHVEVLGLDPATHGDGLRRRIGSQLQDAALPERMRVGEALQLFASLHPAPRPVVELAEEWQLSALWRRPFAALSGGERQRLFVALALVGQPDLVFLDELTQNLDPVAQRRTWGVVRKVRNAGTTVVLVTHDVEEAERLCDRVAILHRGRVVAEGTPTAIVDDPGAPGSVTFTDRDLDLSVLHGLPGLQRVERQGAQVQAIGTGPLLVHVGARLLAVGRPPLDLAPHRPTLEEQFVALTDGSSRS